MRLGRGHPCNLTSLHLHTMKTQLQALTTQGTQSTTGSAATFLLAVPDAHIEVHSFLAYEETYYVPRGGTYKYTIYFIPEWFRVYVGLRSTCGRLHNTCRPWAPFLYAAGADDDAASLLPHHPHSPEYKRRFSLPKKPTPGHSGTRPQVDYFPPTSCHVGIE